MEKFAVVDRHLDQIDPDKTEKIFEIVNRQRETMKNVAGEIKTDNSAGRDMIAKQITDLTL